MGNEAEELAVGGFVFESLEEAQAARKELDGIKILRKKIDKKNPRLVLEIYNKILEKKLYKTPIGLSYMRELQGFLIESQMIKEEEIANIPIEPIRDKVISRIKKDEYITKSNRKSYKTEYRTAIVINIMLVLAILSMILITYFGKNPTIMNYENKIINKYAQWEQELDAREKAVLEAEKAVAESEKN